ncbi:microaggregate-binding protein 1 [Nocardia takedensis]|uniref:microaggregate-binding protein 1 n=1 Tax=Nocardia takedensis TaxID=259390 RepID=UPI00031854A6|nr:CsbD family protein [Nocardia takedensis]
MPEHGNGVREGVEGVVEDVKGKAKEAAGLVTGHNDLKEEGRAQQDKAESQREAAQKEAAAEKARAEADVDEARQAAHQNDR